MEVTTPLLYFFSYLSLLFIKAFFKAPRFKVLFVLACLAGYYLIFMSDLEASVKLSSAFITVSSLVLCYLILNLVSSVKKYFYLAILAPFISFAFFRTQPHFFYLIGQAFLCLRLSYLAFEVSYRKVKMPSPLDYLCYAFFLPTFPLGPLTPFSTFQENLNLEKKPCLNLEMLTRFSFGLVKAFALSTIVFKLSFESMFYFIALPTYELVLSGMFFYIALYLKLSGLYDMIIVTSATLGFRVAENFNNPLLSRNIQDHWRRWHISLLTYFREVFFFPLSINLQRRWGKALELPILVALTFLIFTLIALWHGPKIEYLHFGWLHALGVSVVIVFDRILKNILKDKYQSYLKSRLAYALSWALTFVYIGITYIFYEGLEFFNSMR